MKSPAKENVVRVSIERVEVLLNNENCDEKYLIDTFSLIDNIDSIIDIQPGSYYYLSQSNKIVNNNCLWQKMKVNLDEHFYGFNYALGGIVALTGEDFELTNGYPNFWGWGMEDNVLQKRCEALNLFIDRSHFFQLFWRSA